MPKLTHTCERSHECDECGKKFKLKRTLNAHKLTHGKRSLHTCDECGKGFLNKYDLTIHKRRYTGERLHYCGECGLEFTHECSLNVHIIITHGVKMHYCNKCDYKTSHMGHLNMHKLTHICEKMHTCGDCDYTSSQKGHLIRHIKSVHGPEGQARQRKQERRIILMLKRWGFGTDTEVVINARNGNCVSDTHRYFSRLDFVIVNCVNAILILEVDEDQHHIGYELSCEFSRMVDVQSALVKAGNELPIYWIRYNPNGKYYVGNEQVKIHRPEREVALKSKLEELCSTDFKPENQVNIHYMYYDLISHEEGPEILEDPDFPDALKECVTWN